MPLPDAEDVVAFYCETVFETYLGDPPDSEFQRGYLAGVLAVYREALGKPTESQTLLKIVEMAHTPLPEEDLD